ncbi:site-specific integrase, partial [Klebsiella pneumoniae]|nr:site-specific integrase [Klebsiella pneumoniae]
KFYRTKTKKNLNYEFSKKINGDPGGVREAEQEKIRSKLMGWAPGSGTSQIYNKRFIQDKSHKVAIKLQEDINKKGEVE